MLSFCCQTKWKGNHILIMYTKSVGPTARLVDEIQKKPITSPIHKIRFCSVFVSLIMVENRPCKRTLNFLFSGRLANGRGINRQKKAPALNLPFNFAFVASFGLSIIVTKLNGATSRPVTQYYPTKTKISNSRSLILGCMIISISISNQHRAKRKFKHPKRFHFPFYDLQKTGYTDQDRCGRSTFLFQILNRRKSQRKSTEFSRSSDRDIL